RASVSHPARALDCWVDRERYLRTKSGQQNVVHCTSPLESVTVKTPSGAGQLRIGSSCRRETSNELSYFRFFQDTLLHFGWVCQPEKRGKSPRNFMLPPRVGRSASSPN